MSAIVRRASSRSFPGRQAGHVRAAPSAAAVGLALVLAVAGCGSNDGGLKMKSHALRIEPLAIAPSPQGAGTFEVQAEGVSEGNAWQTQVFFIPAGANRFEFRQDASPLLKINCSEPDCGNLIRVACTSSVAPTGLNTRRIDCLDSRNQVHGSRDFEPGIYVVTAYFWPAINLSFDDDPVDSEVTIILE
jgi:hypothetical protein